MTQRWLCISTRENADVVEKMKIWGVAKRYQNTMAKVKKGDTLLIYAMQTKIGDKILPSVITGEYQALSDVYDDDSQIFKSPPILENEHFPIRLKLRPINLFNPPVEFKPLIPKLGFIKNKVMWTGHIRGAMRTIPEEDYRKIVSAR
jgi:predicted RNA-binding protein